MDADYNLISNHKNVSYNPNYNWKDITSEFFEFIKELEFDELLHGSSFSLTEAMSAIEIMNPKIDAGMICNRQSKAIKLEDLKLSGLTVSEKISIIDVTLACLVSWLEGNSLALTVFTNLYFQKPYEIKDESLKCFCICIYKIIEQIRDVVIRARVFEEKDFNPEIYNYYYFNEISDQQVIGMMREINVFINNDLFKTNENESYVALNSRIKFVRLLLQILLSFNRCENNSSLMGVTQRLLSTCGSLIPYLIKTVNKGIPKVGNWYYNLGFDPFINQKLLQSTSSQYPKIKSAEDAYVYFDSLLTRLKQICQLTNCVNFINAWELFIELGYNNQLCIVSSSIMQTLYFPQPNRVFGTQDFDNCLREWAKSFIAPPSLISSLNMLSNYQAKDLITFFFKHCTHSFAKLIHICGYNIIRQRNKLAILLIDFSNLHKKSQRVDAFMHALSSKLDYPKDHIACISTWIIYHTIRIMIMYLLSGFKLELYSTHEYQYIYWYLHKFLYDWLMTILNRAHHMLLDNEIPQNNHAIQNNLIKNKTHPHMEEIEMYRAMRHLTGAFFKGLIGFQLDEKIHIPKYAKYDNERVRFEHRFAAFSTVTVPPPFSYNDFQVSRYQAQTTASGDAALLYYNSCELFHKAICILDKIPQPHSQQVLGLIKICKTNFITMKLLASVREPNMSLDFDFTINSYFPTLKLTKHE